MCVCVCIYIYICVCNTHMHTHNTSTHTHTFHCHRTAVDFCLDLGDVLEVLDEDVPGNCLDTLCRRIRKLLVDECVLQPSKHVHLGARAQTRAGHWHKRGLDRLPIGRHMTQTLGQRCVPKSSWAESVRRGRQHYNNCHLHHRPRFRLYLNVFVRDKWSQRPTISPRCVAAKHKKNPSNITVARWLQTAAC